MSKKLLKQIEGATIEKVTADAGTGKVRIKTSAGTVTIVFTVELEDSGLDFSPVVNIDFKEPKVPKIKFVSPLPAQSHWPFPTGNKP